MHSSDPFVWLHFFNFSDDFCLFSLSLKEKFFWYKQPGCGSRHSNHWFLFHSDFASVCRHFNIALQCHSSTLSTNRLDHQSWMSLTCLSKRDSWWLGIISMAVSSGTLYPEYRQAMKASGWHADDCLKRMQLMTPWWRPSNYPLPTTKDMSPFVALLYSMTKPRLLSKRRNPLTRVNSFLEIV
jgi:hypothetical protein